MSHSTLLIAVDEKEQLWTVAPCFHFKSTPYLQAKCFSHFVCWIAAEHIFPNHNFFFYIYILSALSIGFPLFPFFQRRSNNWIFSCAHSALFPWIVLDVQKFTVDIGHEMFLGPEIFFSPEMFSGDYTVPLPELVDQTIMSSPLDCRRSLYNVCLTINWVWKCEYEWGHKKLFFFFFSLIEYCSLWRFDYVQELWKKTAKRYQSFSGRKNSRKCSSITQKCEF